MLGYTDYCANDADATYFTVDPINGTHNLLTELPSGAASVSPVGINDSGQILVDITPIGGPAHWGILQPTAPAQARRSMTRPARR